MVLKGLGDAKDGATRTRALHVLRCLDLGMIVLLLIWAAIKNVTAADRVQS
jgi:hypothetical protein